MSIQKNFPFKSVSFAIVAIGFALLQANSAEASLNSKISNYCKHNLNKKVGRGECTDLATAAFRYAGARRFGPSGPDADYVWGREIFSIRISGGLQIEGNVSWTRVKPGDVIQFRNAYFQGRKSNGSTYWKSARHHTAVVLAVQNGGRDIYVYHQNSGQKRYVTAALYRLNDLQRGWLKIYRPIS